MTIGKVFIMALFIGALCGLVKGCSQYQTDLHKGYEFNEGDIVCMKLTGEKVMILEQGLGFPSDPQEKVRLLNGEVISVNEKKELEVCPKDDDETHTN